MSDLSRDDEIAKHVETIQKSVQGIPGQIKKLDESLRQDLEVTRKMAEDGRASADTLATQQKVIGEKFAALEALQKAHQSQLDGVNAMLSRSPIGGGEGKGAGDERDQAREFKRLLLNSSNRINVDVGEIEAAEVDDLRGYAKAYPHYLRGGDAAMERALGERKALSVANDPGLGWWVPPAQSARILTKIYETSPIRQLATVETIGSDSIEYPVDEGEFGFGWVAEMEGRPETATSNIGVMRIDVDEMYAEPRITQKLIDDATVDVEAWAARKIAERFARGENTAFVVGNGVKKPRGLLTYPDGVGRGKIPRVPSGHASEFSADALKMIPFSDAFKEFYQANARWLFKRSSVGKISVLKGSDGQYLFQLGLAGGLPTTLAGFPISTADDMPAVAPGALAGMFGDFRAGYTVVDRLGIRVIRDIVTAKPFIKLYSTRRVGGAVTTYEALTIIRIGVA